MKNFWCLATNGKYSIGCTGQSTYVYDNCGNELAVFKKDIIYAYLAVISPKGDIFVVKSTDGRFAIYSFEKLCLIKKFRYSSVDYSQDDSFCFSKDGSMLFNIERYIDDLHTRIAVYDTADFSVIRYIEYDNLWHIEYDENEDVYFLLGQQFIAKFDGKKIFDLIQITENEFDYYVSYKRIEMNGFTDKSKHWSTFSYNDVDINSIENNPKPLSKLLKYRKENVTQ
ncbi:MAG: hypothetical protein ACI4XC_04035 [Eubacterium sp.]